MHGLCLENSKAIAVNKPIKYPVVIYPAEEGGYVAEAPALKGCLAQGETMLECLEELELVTKLWIESARFPTRKERKKYEENAEF